MASRDLSLIALFAALTAVCAQLSVALPLMTRVPFTLQVFAVLTAGAVLGARRGALSQVVYLLLGAVGIPVFARLSGGLQILLGPTGGYLWAFPLAAAVAGWAADRASAGGGRALYLYAGILAGIAVIYALGVAGLLASGAVQSLRRALQVGVVPFLWFDLLKGYLAGLVSLRVRSAVLGERRPAPLG